MTTTEIEKKVSDFFAQYLEVKVIDIPEEAFDDFVSELSDMVSIPFEKIQMGELGITSENIEQIIVDGDTKKVFIKYKQKE